MGPKAELEDGGVSKAADRKAKLLLYIERFDFVRADQVAKLLGITTRGARYKLKEMKEEGYLISFCPGNRKYTYNYYTITLKAAQFITETLNNVKMSELICRCDYDAGNKISAKNLQHSEGINDYFTTLLDQSRTHGVVGPQGWRNSRESHLEIPGDTEDLIPDSFCEFNIDGVKLPFYFEFDRGTEDASIVLDKFKRYTLFAESSEMEAYGYDTLRVLFLTQLEGRAKTIKNMVESWAGGTDHYNTLKKNVFLLSWSVEITGEDLLNKTWLRIFREEQKCFAPWPDEPPSGRSVAVQESAGQSQ